MKMIGREVLFLTRHTFENTQIKICPNGVPGLDANCQTLPTVSWVSIKAALRMPSFTKGKNKGIPSVMNAFVTILMCVCLLGCLPHSSASTFHEIPPPDLDCRTVEFVDDAPSRFASSNVEIKVRRSIRYTWGCRCRRKYNSRCWCKWMCCRTGIETN